MRISLAIIFLLMLILPDTFISLAFLRKARWWKHILCWLPSIAAFLMAILWISGVHGAVRWLTYIMVCCSLPKLAFVCFTLLGLVLGIFHKKLVSIFLKVACGAYVLVFCGALFGCTIGRNILVENCQDIECQNLPDEFEHYKIVHISDLHLGTFSNDSRLVAKMVAQVNAQNPDLIVFTGDLINISANEIEPYSKALSSLRARDGVVSILGNHDYGTYGRYHTPDGQQKNLEKLIQTEKELGWKLLIDSNVIITRNHCEMAVLGVGNIGKPPFKELGDLKKAMTGVADSSFKILLSHDPSHWRLEVLPKTDIPLMLSGHTHAMQFKLGRFSPIKWKYEEWGGLYNEGKQQLFVSTGIGGSFPFRLGAYPEIAVLTLHKKSHI